MHVKLNAEMTYVSKVSQSPNGFIVESNRSTIFLNFPIQMENIWPNLTRLEQMNWLFQILCRNKRLWGDNKTWTFQFRWVENSAIMIVKTVSFSLNFQPSKLKRLKVSGWPNFVNVFDSFEIGSWSISRKKIKSKSNNLTSKLSVNNPRPSIDVQGIWICPFEPPVSLYLYY